MTDQQTLNDVKPNMTAKTPSELIQFNIINMRNEVIQSYGEIEQRRTPKGEYSLSLINKFRGKTIALFQIVRTLVEDSYSKETEKIESNLNEIKDIRKIYPQTKEAYFLIEDLIRKKGITRIDNRKEVDRSRVWKANEADGSPEIGHPWWQEKNPYWLEQIKKNRLEQKAFADEIIKGSNGSKDNQ